MTLTNSYATLNAFKPRALSVQITGSYSTDTERDGIVMGMLEAASRWIDAQCFRKFYTSIETRYYTARRSVWLGIDDLVSVTSLKTDDTGTRAWGTTWATTDYDLEPYDARNNTPALPYRMLRTTPNGTRFFPLFTKGVQIAGTWGFADQTLALSTLSSGVNASVTTWPVASGTLFEVGHIAKCGDEQAYVDAVSSNNLTVRRGANGTTAATHDSGATVSIYQFGAITEACLLRAQILYMRKSAPLGQSGQVNIGRNQQNANKSKGLTDDDVLDLLAGYRRPGT